MSGYESKREAKSPEALRHLLATERDWRCPMGVTRKGEYEPCENNATAVVTYEFEGEWFLDPVCTFHANRAGRGNGIHLADLLHATREDHR